MFGAGPGDHGGVVGAERDRGYGEADAFAGGEIGEAGAQALIGGDATGNDEDVCVMRAGARDAQRGAGAIDDGFDDGLLEGGAEIGDGLIVERGSGLRRRGGRRS